MINTKKTLEVEAGRLLCPQLLVFFNIKKYTHLAEMKAKEHTLTSSLPSSELLPPLSKSLIVSTPLTFDEGLQTDGLTPNYWLVNNMCKYSSLHLFAYFIAAFLWSIAKLNHWISKPKVFIVWFLTKNSSLFVLENISCFLALGYQLVSDSMGDAISHREWAGALSHLPLHLSQLTHVHPTKWEGSKVIHWICRRENQGYIYLSCIFKENWFA